jgi:hypothetical protein
LGTLAVGVYHTPLGVSSEKSLQRVYETLADGSSNGQDTIDVMMGRKLTIPRAAKGRVAWFEYSQLCESAVGPADYLALAKAYPAVIVSNVPVMTFDQREKIRRFINLLDVLYDHGVRFIASAAASPRDLFRPHANDAGIAASSSSSSSTSKAPPLPSMDKLQGAPSTTASKNPTSISVHGQREDEGFAAGRAVSRLIEMQTDVQLGKIMKSPQFKKSAIKILATRVQAILTAERKNWVVDTPPQPPAATSAPNGTNGNVPPAAIAAKTTAASTSAAAAKSNAVTTGAPPAKVATAPAKSSPPSTTSTSSTAAASKPVASSGTPAKQANGTTSSTPSSSPTASGSRPTGSTPSLTIVAGSNKGGDRKVVFILFLVFLTFSYSSHFTRC